MKKTVLIYGILAAAISFILTIFMPKEMSVEALNRGMLLGYTCLILSGILICFGIASYKKNQLGGHISYGKAISVGLLTTLVASTLYVGLWMAMYEPFFSGFGKGYSELMTAEMRKKGESEESIKELQENMVRYDNDAIYRAAVTYLEPLSVQVPIVLIGSIFISLRRRKK